MVEIGADGGQLNEIARFHLADIGVKAERSHALIAREKIVKIRNAGPGRRTVVGIAVIPAVDRGKVHNAAAGVKTLAGKIGAVAADLLKIVIGRIAEVGPFVGVGHGGIAVIGQKLGQGRTPLLKLK